MNAPLLAAMNGLSPPGPALALARPVPGNGGLVAPPAPA